MVQGNRNWRTPGFTTETENKAVDVVQLTECLLTMHEVLGSLSTLHKLVIHTCNPSTPEIEDQEFKATLSFREKEGRGRGWERKRKSKKRLFFFFLKQGFSV